MTKMNPTVKARWLAALRSGKYAQGRQSLRDGDCFCCLGVLCDITDPAQWVAGDEESPIWSYSLDGVSEFPPRALLDVVGFDWEKVEVEIAGVTETLYDHNDHGRTFAEIADAIEEQL